MSLVSSLIARQLPEKPWRVEAVVRLIASIIVCIMLGAVVSAVAHYFEEPARKSPALFFGGSAIAAAMFSVGLLLLAKAWPVEKYLRNLLILFICVYVGFFIMWLASRLTGGHGEIANSTLRVLIAVLAFQGAALVLVHFFLRAHHTNWAEGFGLDNRTEHAVLLGIGVGIFVLPLVWALQGVSVWILEHLMLQPHEQEAVELLRATQGWPSRIILGVATIVLAPIAEEVIFRGILYPAIKRAGYPRAALWGTALLFGLIHFNVATFLPLSFLAVALVFVYEYTGNLLACITVHSFFNAANFVALYLFQNQK